MPASKQALPHAGRAQLVLAQASAKRPWAFQARSCGHRQTRWLSEVEVKPPERALRVGHKLEAEVRLRAAAAIAAASPEWHPPDPTARRQRSNRLCATPPSL